MTVNYFASWPQSSTGGVGQRQQNDEPGRLRLKPSVNAALKSPNASWRNAGSYTTKDQSTSRPPKKQGKDEHQNMNFQRRFFNIAKWMLACNLRAMGGAVIGQKIVHDDLEGSLLGLSDNSKGMWILCQQQLGKQVRFEPGKGWSAT